MSRFIALIGGALAAALCSSQAQSHQPPATHPAFQIVDRGPHHRAFEQVLVSTNARAGTITQTNRYTELEIGMHYRENGRWLPTVEGFLPSPTGAEALQGPHKIRLKHNSRAAGLFDILTPDNLRLRGQVLGLALVDTASGDSVWLGEIQSAQAEILPPNQVIYRDAFENVRADLLFTYAKGGFEQDVILREQLPWSPQDLGLNDETSFLQVVTEFIEAPAPAKTRRPTPAIQVHDEVLDFGSLQMAPGKAFTLPDPHPNPDWPRGLHSAPGGTRVFKEWRQQNDRTVLLESTPWPEIQPLLQALPPTTRQPNRKPARQRAAAYPALPLDPQPPAPAPARVASLTPALPGVVIDYTLSGALTDYTFQANTTYFITGPLQLNGTTRLEPATVLKFNAATAYLIVLGNLYCMGTESQPSFLTARHDASVGVSPPGEPTTPSGYYAAKALWLYYHPYPLILAHLRIRYAQEAVVIDAPTSPLITHSIQNVRIENSAVGIRNNNAVAQLSAVVCCNVPTPTTGAGQPRFTGSAIASDSQCNPVAPNAVPAVRITSPTDGTTLQAPIDLVVHTTATDPDGYLAKVELYNHGIKWLERTASPLTFTLPNAAAGPYNLVAIAYDNRGAVASSPNIRFDILPDPATPPPSTTTPAGSSSSPALASLVNANFGGGLGGQYIKSGPAATGIGPADFWNNIPQNQPGPLPLLRHDGSSSGISMTVENASGVWGNSSGDPMYDVYLCNFNTHIRVRLTGLPNGFHDLFLYGHGAADPQNSTFDLTLNDLTALGQKSTSTSHPYNNATWEEGRQYVVFRSIPVTAPGVILISIPPAADGFSVVNGLQLLQNATPQNQPPSVQLTLPVDGTTFAAPARIDLAATALDSDGAIQRVRFFNGPTSIADDPSPPYTTAWIDAPAGTYTLTAQATDYSGATSISLPVTVRVLTQPPNLEPGLVGHWRLDDASGRIAVDSSQHGLHGSLRYEPAWTQGPRDGALLLNGWTDSVQIPDTQALRIATDLTVAFWMRKTTEHWDWTRLVGKGGYWNRNFGIWEEPGGGQRLLFQQYAGYNASVLDLYSRQYIPVATWTHVAAVIRNNSAELYINGTLDTSAPRSGIPATSTDPLTLGYAGYHSYFPGALDDVRIYSYALAPSEIQALLNPTGADSDHDGLPDSWELTHFGSLTHSAQGDYDADGRSNRFEYDRASNPADAWVLRVFTPLR